MQTTTHDGLAIISNFPEPERVEAFRRTLPETATSDAIAPMRSACAIFTGEIRTLLEERIQAIHDVVSGVPGARDNFDLDNFRI